MVVIEVAIMVGSAVLVYGVSKLSKKLGYKIKKKHIKKYLYLAFDSLDIDMLKKSFSAVKDFDSKHNTNKMDKYLFDIVQRFRDDDDKPTLNEKVVLGLKDNFDDVRDILDNEDEEILIRNDVDERLEEVREVLQDVEQRRKEMIIRKNAIRAQMLEKNKRKSKTKRGSMA
jgi:hypothetical protein